jgi:peptidoglycan/xylan/chitin deacetylase (PgdA/CDA1 family)
MRKVILTVDLESDWETKETEAIEHLLPKFLAYLKERKAKATFFIVGEIAEKFPKQVKQIIKEGHEVASHGLTHQNLTKLTFDELEKEISDSKNTIEKLGAKVRGFRAPRGEAPQEMYDILKKYNYTYSSSVIASWFPGRYNEINNAQIHKRNDVLELPVPNFSKFKVPAGLSYVRLMHPILNKSFAKKPYMIYVHLHEFIKKPMSKDIPLHVKVASTRNRGDKAWKIFKNCTKNMKFISCEEFIKSQLSLGKIVQ